MYGQRALIIGALNPLNFVGTYEHTAARLKPFQRLARTAEAFETIFFGTRAEADKVLAYVAKLHSPGRGRARRRTPGRRRPGRPTRPSTRS